MRQRLTWPALFGETLCRSSSRHVEGCFPLIADQLNDVAVAIDGDIYADPGYQPLRADSEVHLVPRIAGG